MLEINDVILHSIVCVCVSLAGEWLLAAGGGLNSFRILQLLLRAPD